MKTSKFAILAAAGALAAGAFADVSMSKVGEYDIDVNGCGGIAYVGGNSYYAVRDHNDDNVAELYPLTIETNPSTGAIVSHAFGSAIALTGSSDAEGVAYDPYSGNLWLSDESSPTISEYDTSGAKLRSVTVPAIQRTKKRGNKSLEALAISGDGLTMWSCNEEALYCDGDAASASDGTVVRLMKFTRGNLSDTFTHVGEWAYKTEKCAGSLMAQNGVPGLCALPDGSLLVLEREVSAAIPLSQATFGRCQIYRVEASQFTAANDVSSFDALTNANYSVVSKGSPLVSFQSGDKDNIIVYEGICLGPRLTDGSLAVYLISDGGVDKTVDVPIIGTVTAYTASRLCALKLSGLDVHTIGFDAPAKGTSSVVGSNYRYMAGDSVAVALDGGVQTAPSAYTNNTEVCTDVGWTVGGQSGSGETAAFTVVEDGVFAWTFTDSSPAATPIVGGDTFEEYDAGDEAGAAVRHWSGDGVVEDGTPDEGAAGYPMAKATHERVLVVDGLATRTYSSATNGNQKLELMVTTQKAPDDLETPDDCQLVVACDADGYLCAYCGDANGTLGWKRLVSSAFADETWLRLSVFFDYTSNPGGAAFAQIFVDGVPCATDDGVKSPVDTTAGGAWYRLAANRGRISALSVHGSCKVDDVVLGMTHFETEVKPGFVQLDVPAWWLEKYGLGGYGLDAFFCGSDAATQIVSGGRTYSLADAFTAGVDPTGTEPLRFVGIERLADGRVRLELNGVREDKSDPTDAYKVYGSTALDGLVDDANLVPGAASVDADRGVTVWTSTSPIDEYGSFFRVKAVR